MLRKTTILLCISALLMVQFGCASPGPKLLHMELSARLINARDNTVEFEHLYTYGSPEYNKFQVAKWGEDEAALFSKELAEATDELTFRVIEDLFIRTE